MRPFGVSGISVNNYTPKTHDNNIIGDVLVGILKTIGYDGY